MVDEMTTLHNNVTWEMVLLPFGKFVVGYQWVFMNGTVERYKVRLVTNGYTQTYDIEYVETFSLVANIGYVSICISLATNLVGLCTNWM